MFAILSLMPGMLFAQQEHARVIRVEPRYVTVNQQQCQEVQVHIPGQSGNDAGSVLGAIAGAAIGNQFGGGSGKDIATVVGGVIGYNAGRGDPMPGRTEQRMQCSYVPVMVQRGETVTFYYRGKTFKQVFE